MPYLAPSEAGSLGVRVGRTTHRLVTHWVGQGWPGRVREVLRAVGKPWPRSHVVVARNLSPGAIAILTTADANWIEEDGRAYVRTNTGLIIERDVERPVRTSGPVVFRWSPARADVAEVILAAGSVLPVREIAEITSWSREQVSEALRHFDRVGWTQKRGAKRGRTSERVIAAIEVLRENWAEHAGSAVRERLIAHGIIRDPLSYLERDLAPSLKTLGRWAVSGWAGSALVAPKITTIPLLQIYVNARAFDSRLRPSLTQWGLREVTTGARVEFWSARPAALYLPLERRGVQVVHAHRLYADLLALGERGGDAAREVLEVLLAG